MSNRLADAVSPYLRSHADNPVDWREWGTDPFREAADRDVPVLVSIGYSTCHWCHVMARESFSDPELADHLNERFVAIKVDREEYPDVDASYLAAAGAFTENLGWPLNVFVTPAGRAFFAGTYFPPRAAHGHPAFRTVLDAVTDAWTNRRAEVESNAAAIAGALGSTVTAGPSDLPSAEAFDRVVHELVGYEDAEHGGFGAAPKFPVAPVLEMLLDRGSIGGADAAALAARTLDAVARSALRDGLDGGFFRYSTRRDWTEPHYERMLYDNAQLLRSYSRVGDERVAQGIAALLGDTMRLPGGAFASAQDSESTVDGSRVEGGYYLLDAAGRARQHPPALDEKVLTGWNGLAVEALAEAGSRLGRAEWVELARAAADYLLASHLRDDGTLVRASIGERMSEARSTLEDYGMFASGLLAVAIATGECRYAAAARSLVDAAITAGGSATTGDSAPSAFSVPGGADPVLLSQGLALESDPSEGAYPSGVSAIAGAAHTLYLLTAERRYLDASIAAMLPIADLAMSRPISFGAAISVMTGLTSPVAQLVVVVPDETSDRGGQDDTGSFAASDPDGTTTFAASDPHGAETVADLARTWDRAGSIAAVVTETQAREFADAGFELFASRVPSDGRATAYLCRDFVCRLPLTEADELAGALRELD